MSICVRYFAQLKRAAGVSEETLPWIGPCTLDDLLTRLADSHGEGLRSQLFRNDGRRQPSIVVSIGDRHVPPGEQVELRDGDLVTLLAPISGG
jgi:molybdopterin converting factor small subunit